MFNAVDGYNKGKANSVTDGSGWHPTGLPAKVDPATGKVDYPLYIGDNWWYYAFKVPAGTVLTLADFTGRIPIASIFSCV